MGSVGVMVASPSTDREVGSWSPHTPGGFEVSKVLYDISKLLAAVRTCNANIVCVYISVRTMEYICILKKIINYHKNKISVPRVEAGH